MFELHQEMEKMILNAIMDTYVKDIMNETVSNILYIHNGRKLA